MKNAQKEATNMQHEYELLPTCREGIVYTGKYLVDNGLFDIDLPGFDEDELVEARMKASTRYDPFAGSQIEPRQSDIMNTINQYLRKALQFDFPPDASLEIEEAQRLSRFRKQNLAAALPIDDENNEEGSNSMMDDQPKLSFMEIQQKEIEHLKTKYALSAEDIKGIKFLGETSRLTTREIIGDVRAKMERFQRRRVCEKWEALSSAQTNAGIARAMAVQAASKNRFQLQGTINADSDAGVPDHHKSLGVVAYNDISFSNRQDHHYTCETDPKKFPETRRVHDILKAQMKTLIIKIANCTNDEEKKKLETAKLNLSVKYKTTMDMITTMFAPFMNYYSGNNRSNNDNNINNEQENEMLNVDNRRQVDP